MHVESREIFAEAFRDHGALPAPETRHRRHRRHRHRKVTGEKSAIFDPVMFLSISDHAG